MPVNRGKFLKLCYDDIKFKLKYLRHKRFMRLKRYIRNAGFDFADKTMGAVISYCLKQ